MTNFDQPGDVLTFTAPSGGVVSGEFYEIGSFLVCATHDAAAGAAFTGKLTGVFTVHKPTGQAWTQGQKVYFDEGTSPTRFTTSAVGNAPAGAATAAAGTNDTTGHVRLDGISNTEFAT